VLIKELQSLALDVELLETPEAQAAREAAERDLGGGPLGAPRGTVADKNASHA
jgi:DNA-directed RNA polymerase subunit beta